MIDLAEARDEMIDVHLRGRGIDDERALDAMRRVPREEFVPEAQREHAYADHPLRLSDGQTISQPYIVALMVEAAAIRPGDSVLDVGTGSGYAAAVAAELAVDVYSIERIQDLAGSARKRLARLGYGRVTVVTGDGRRGLREHAPFDAILVAAAASAVPDALIDQLAEGGRLIIPVSVGAAGQTLLRITRRGDSVETDELGAVTFVPLVSPQNGFPPRPDTRS